MIRTWLISGGVTNLGECRQATKSQQDGQAKKYDGIQPNPNSVHDEDELVRIESKRDSDCAEFTAQIFSVLTMSMLAQSHDGIWILLRHVVDDFVSKSETWKQ